MSLMDIILSIKIEVAKLDDGTNSQEVFVILGELSYV
jgi:hypothetical protein